MSLTIDTSHPNPDSGILSRAINDTISLCEKNAIIMLNRGNELVVRNFTKRDIESFVSENNINYSNLYSPEVQDITCSQVFGFVNYEEFAKHTSCLIGGDEKDLWELEEINMDYDEFFHEVYLIVCRQKPPTYDEKVRKYNEDKAKLLDRARQSSLLTKEGGVSVFSREIVDSYFPEFFGLDKFDPKNGGISKFYWIKEFYSMVHQDIFHFLLKQERLNGAGFDGTSIALEMFSPNGAKYYLDYSSDSLENYMYMSRIVHNRFDPPVKSYQLLENYMKEILEKGSMTLVINLCIFLIWSPDPVLRTAFNEGFLGLVRQKFPHNAIIDYFIEFIYREKLLSTTDLSGGSDSYASKMHRATWSARQYGRDGNEYNQTYKISREYNLSTSFLFPESVIKSDGKNMSYDVLLNQVGDLWQSDSILDDKGVLLQLLHSDFILERIEKDIGIHFSDYPFSIQPHFLTFLAYATHEDMAQVRDYLARGKTTDEKYNRLRVFLAIGESRDFGDLILNIDKKLIERFGDEQGADLGNALFAKYARIMQIAETDADKIVEDLYGKDSSAHFSKRAYIRELLQRANDVLEQFYSVIEKEGSYEVIMTELEQWSVDVVQYGSLFRITEKGEMVSLGESIQNLGIRMDEISGNQMNDSQKSDIQRLYEVNYREYEKKEALFQFIQDGLEQNYLDSKAHFHLFYSQQGRCLLSAKFVEQPDGSVYFGAFNTDLQFQKYSFGTFALEKLLEKYSDREIWGHILADKPKLLDFYRKFGFEIEMDEDLAPKVSQKGGIDLIEIRRKAQKQTTGRG